MTDSMNTETYPFHNYICGVTGLTCCGCSLFCEHREGNDKQMINNKTVLPVISKEQLTEMNKMSSDEKELLDKKPKQAKKFRDEVMEVFEKYNVKDELALHVGLKMLRGERKLGKNKNENANRTDKED